MTDSALNLHQCLKDEDLTEYLDGALDPAIKAATEAHLVACDDCRVRLAMFVRLLKHELTPVELVTVNQIEESWRRAQREPSIATAYFSRYRRLRLLSGTAVAALLIAFGTQAVMDYRSEPRTAHEVIRLLLAESRPFEARMADQPPLPFSGTRSLSDSGGASGLLAVQMSRLGATTYEMGQFHLLHRDFSNAVKYLELAAQETIATAEVHNDLGVAYMESGDPANRSKAVGEFRRAVALRREFPAAAYNLAVLYSRMGRPDESEAQWKQYLQLEADSRWKDEAAAKLEALKH
jgi:tetratricopeptide (TPR) repeat protein